MYPTRGSLPVCASDEWTGARKRQPTTMAIARLIISAAILSCCSPNHLIRPVQHRLRNRETDLFRCFEIDHKLELRWLFDRKIAGLGAFKDLIYVRAEAPVHISNIRPVTHETSNFHKLLEFVYSW